MTQQLIRVPTPGWMKGATSQGVSRPDEELDYLPFTNPADGLPFIVLAAGATGKLVVNPQRPFRGERLVIAAFQFGGTGNAFNVVVIDPALYVGAVQIGAAQGQAPISAFSAESFGVRLTMPAAGQGTAITLPLANILPSNVQFEAVVSATLFGRAVR